MVKLSLLAESVASGRLTERAKKIFEDESAELKKLYPAFDLKRELKNPVFSRLLSLGADMKSAFHAANFEALTYQAMRYAAEKTAQAQTMASPRVGENAVGNTAAAKAKPDIGSFTRRDIMRIIEEAGKGAKITFR